MALIVGICTVVQGEEQLLVAAPVVDTVTPVRPLMLVERKLTRRAVGTTKTKTSPTSTNEIRRASANEAMQMKASGYYLPKRKMPPATQPKRNCKYKTQVTVSLSY